MSRMLCSSDNRRRSRAQETSTACRVYGSLGRGIWFFNDMLDVTMCDVRVPKFVC